LAVVDPVDRGDGAVLERALDAVHDPLEAVEPPLDAAPAGGDEIDEEREVLDPRLALGREVALQPLEPANGLGGEPADLRNVAGDRQDLGPETLLESAAKLLRDARLELGRGLGKRLEAVLRLREGGLDVRRPGAVLVGAGEAHAGSFEGFAIHGSSLIFDSDVGMKTSELDYDLPPELVAQRPLERRDESRLLVYDRRTGDIRHRRFRDLPEEVDEGELVVVNDTRVVPARLRLRRPGGGEAEVLLLEPAENGVWEALARPTRRLRPGMRLGPVELLGHLGEGRWRVRLAGEPAGEPPLPPYITEPLSDPERYQTIYADEAGSAAAPTAGLHFTPELLAGLDVERVTLHVGLDTFRPISAETLERHELHSERYRVSAAAWERIRPAERVVAVGTTTVRVLESLARGAPLEGRTNLFVTPGFEFARTDALVTNFHLPRSSLLALVMAFAGIEETRRLYRLAIEERYRFYSFGDAMLVR
jgi:S-adenosylmethionine:tRNA ribosyltransferase-isomerase